VRDPLGYQQAIGALRQYSLIKISQDRQALSVHRLVQAVTRQQVDPEQQDQWATAALRLLRAAFPDRLGDAAAWSEYARLLPHALAVVEHTAAGGIDFDQTAWLVGEAASTCGSGPSSSKPGGCTSALLRSTRPAWVPNTPTPPPASTTSPLSYATRATWTAPAPSHERALAIREARLGPDHPETAKSRRNLAAVVDRLETHS
jgi:hypothetical protein